LDTVAKGISMLACVALASASYVLQPTRSVLHGGNRRLRLAPCKAAEKEFGTLASDSGLAPDELLCIQPRIMQGTAKLGELVSFEGGGTGVLIMERCGLYFAAPVEGEATTAGKQRVEQLGAQLAVQRTAEQPWGGICDYLGRPIEQAASSPAPVPGEIAIFDEPVPQTQRKPIGESVHCGIIAVDALTPIGRGQSMAIFGPDALPEGAGRSALANRVLSAQAALPRGLKSILVSSADPKAGEAGVEAQQAAVEALRVSGALESTMVLSAASPTQGVLAMHAACSIAAAEEGDVLVVIDSLAPYLWLWKQSCAALLAKSFDVRAEEEGSQQRTMYAALTERAHRRKDGGSVTLLLLQPSASLKAPGGSSSKAYTVADFEEAGFSQRAIARVAALVDKGVAITEEVCTKLAIPVPGSGHPQGGGARADYQHLEELTSLVDGHIELREALVAAGRQPPLDPSQSLTRIGVGTAKTLKMCGSTPAMLQLNRALRLELAAASDPAGCEPSQRRRAAAYEAVLHQPEARPLPLSDELVLLLAASEGLLDEAASNRGLEEMAVLLRELTAHVRAEAPELLSKLDSTGVLLDDTSTALRALVAAHLEASA